MKSIHVFSVHTILALRNTWREGSCANADLVPYCSMSRVLSIAIPLEFITLEDKLDIDDWVPENCTL